MLSTARRVLLSALLGAAALWPCRADGQGPPPPPAPVDGHEVGPSPALQPPLQDPEAPADPGPNGWTTIYNGPSPPPGPFFSLDVGILHPVLRDRLVPNQPLPSGDRPLVPSVELPWVAAPWLEAGYRLPYSYGLFALGYRFFNAEGNGSVVNNDLLSAVRTRLDLNLIDLDYGTLPYSFAPRWAFDWRTGVRLADVFFDSRIANAAREQQSSENYRSAGFHGRLDLYRCLDAVPGLSLFGRSDGAVLIGRSSQKFREVLAVPGGAPFADSYEQNGIQTVPVLLVQAGLLYAPPRLPGWRFSGGYQFEHWWYVGQLGTESNGNALTQTRGEFGTQGVFLRARRDF